MSSDNKNVSRRDFLKTAGIATGTLVGGGLIGGLIGYNAKGSTKDTASTDHKDEKHNGAPDRGRMFFTKDEDFNILAKATERIFPKDDIGPGAIELGVPYFIDGQLAGQYGSNAKEYMQGPFDVGAPTQGYQSRLNRAQIFTQGIQVMEQEAQSRFKKRFVQIEPKEIDRILTALQKDEVKMVGVTAAFFFKLLRGATLEGVYSDPMYGGNYNMEGWKMKGFPGHQMSYIADIESKDFKKIKPKALGEH